MINIEEVLIALRGKCPHEHLSQLNKLYEDHGKLKDAVEWVLRDASYRAPETVGPETLSMYCNNLRSAL